MLGCRVLLVACGAVLVLGMGLGGCASTDGGSGSGRLDAVSLSMPPEPASSVAGLKNATENRDVIFSGQPTAAQIGALGGAGVTRVVNLRPASEMRERVGFDERAVAEAAGLEYVSIPVSVDGITRGDVAALAEALETAEGRVLVHCGSSGRVGTMWAAYLSLHKGFPMEEAMQQGREAGMRSEALEARARSLILGTAAEPGV